MDGAAEWCCCLVVPSPRPHSRRLPLTWRLKAAPRGRIHLQGQKWPLCVGLGLSSARRQRWTGAVSVGVLGPGLQTGWALGVSVSRVLGGSYRIVVVPAASLSHCNVTPEGTGAASRPQQSSDCSLLSRARAPVVGASWPCARRTSRSHVLHFGGAVPGCSQQSRSPNPWHG